MAKKIIAALIAAVTGPFAMAFGLIVLVIIGISIGFVISDSMEQSKIEKVKAEKAAAAEALKAPLPPQRVPAPEEGPNPFEHRYVSLGEEILSPLPGKARVLQIELDLVTQRGESAEELLTTKRIPMRALVLSILSELTVEQATAADASQAIAAKLKAAINAALQPTYGLNPVERILIKKYYVQ